MSQSKFHHEEILRGKDLVKRLSEFRLTVCGAGALGSNLVDSLARIGFSHIKVIDFDRIENHNISTQLYGDMDVGALKADALKTRIFRHVGTEIEAVNKELTAANAKNLLKNSDLVVDVFDNKSSRQLVQDECRARKIQCLHGGLSDIYGEVMWDKTYRVPKETDGDICDYPLARNIIMLTVCVLSEEILDFCLAEKPRLKNWSITLKDLSIKEMRF